MVDERGGRSSSLRRWQAGLLGPLAGQSFRHLWLSASTSAIGSAFVPVALAFAVLGIGGNATSLGLVLLAGTVAALHLFRLPECGPTGCRGAT